LVPRDNHVNETVSFHKAQKQTVSQDKAGLCWQWPAQEQDNQGRGFIQIRRNLSRRVETMVLMFTNIENLRYIITQGNDWLGSLWCCVHVGNVGSRLCVLREVGCGFCGQSKGSKIC